MLRKLVDDMIAAGHGVSRPVHLSDVASETKPDFVFLGATVTGTADRILVVELKGPNDTANWKEYEQLHSYVSYIQSLSGDSIVEGVLIAGSHDPAMMRTSGRTIV